MRHHRLHGRRCGDVGLGQQQAQQGDHASRQVKVARHSLAERRVGIRDQGADADHVRIELLVEQDVCRNRSKALPRQAHECPRADLIAERAQVAQAAHAVRVVHARVPALVDRLVRRLDAQQIAVGTGSAPECVLLIAALPHRQRHREVELLEATDDGSEALCREIQVLARLQDDCLIAVALCLVRELHDGIGVEPIALDLAVLAPQAAVHAVLAADVREFDEAAQVHAVADECMAHAVSGRSEAFFHLRCAQ